MSGKNYTRIKDLVTGSEGSAYITIDGENRYFFELSKIKANIEFTVIAKKTVWASHETAQGCRSRR